MGLKVVADGFAGAGKTAFAVSMSEVGTIGVVDTESRWQWYTETHPSMKARPEIPGALLGQLIRADEPNPAAARAHWQGVYAHAYGLPRRVRQDVTWLARNDNTIWLAQTMDPILAWHITRVWALDQEIVGIVKDSGSVLWDILQDSKPVKLDPVTGEDKLGGLAWTPVKRTDRRATFTLLKSGKHWIYTAHIQEKMNSKMEVVSTNPWLEKKNPHWADLVIRFHNGPDLKRPRAEVRADKVLGGKGGALRLGSTHEGLTFKRLLDLAGAEFASALAGSSETMEQIDERTKRAVQMVGASPYAKGIDNDPKQGG